ncbi:uncharacterized protein MELLADRAFT_105509 [Melampsora larici-populina 98AG31]|uniref:Uncharacterized protein n=1 Tax=Melampsora larici-populina (strain 98AG31 / pathotype 3-4-7) TaxID=747676 RepID=F4RIG1_MELLP|nr:uncharacterized protein MELLADRAFT_105509 [Melampsora larici-populina 98AG31]EGG07839.1 hypothetical protein MELLADRAFT_105509 [Melampsora larici-populina 98AG31]
MNSPGIKDDGEGPSPKLCQALEKLVQPLAISPPGPLGYRKLESPVEGRGVSEDPRKGCASLIKEFSDGEALNPVLISSNTGPLRNSLPFFPPPIWSPDDNLGQDLFHAEVISGENLISYPSIQKATLAVILSALQVAISYKLPTHNMDVVAE